MDKQKDNSDQDKQSKYPKLIVLVIFTFVIIFAGYYFYQKPALSLSLSVQATPKTIAKGKKIFNNNCATCHGTGAVGEDPAQPKGGLKDKGGYFAPALNGTGHTWHHPKKMLFEVIKKGSIDEESAMKGFAGRLDDEEIIFVMQYFKSLWPKRIQVRYDKNQK